MSSSEGFSDGVWQGLDLKTYKTITASYPVERDYDGDEVFCFCKLKAARWCSWTDRNPGRRFYGCPKYPDFNHCEFHAWHESRFSDRAVEIINELKVRERLLFKKAKEQLSEVEKLRKDSYRLLEENNSLKGEINSMKRLVARKKSCSRWVNVVIFIGLVLFVVFLMQ